MFCRLGRVGNFGCNPNEPNAHPLHEIMFKDLIGGNELQCHTHPFSVISRAKVEKRAVALKEFVHTNEGDSLVPIRKGVVTDKSGVKDGRLLMKVRVEFHTSIRSGWRS